MENETKENEKDMEETTVKVEEVKESNGGIKTLPYYDIHSIVALVLAILSLLAPFQVFGLGGVLGLILGVIALYQVRQSRKLFDNNMNHTAKVIAVIGLVLSVVAIGFSIIMLTSFAWHANQVFTTTQFFNYGPRMSYFHRYW
jgi:succinate-acetate transporter protein